MEGGLRHKEDASPRSSPSSWNGDKQQNDGHPTNFQSSDYPFRDSESQQSFNAFQYTKEQPGDPLRMRTQSIGSNIDPLDEERLQKTHCICAAYLRGQLSNVAKAAVWWSTFGVVAEALTKIPLAVGSTRLVFNLALVIVSPFAGTVSENANIRTLLNYTTWGRLLIWCCFIPASWFYFAAHLSSFTSFYICFLILMFLDGIQVSFANVVDIDCGGLDTLASQYKLSIGNYLRDRFNRIHQIVFDLSFILLTPPVAFFIWQIAFRVNRNSISDDTQMHPPSSQTYPPSDLPSFSNNTLSSSNSTFSDITPINTTSSFPSSIGFSNSSLSLSFDPLSLSSMEDSSPIRTVVVEESENIDVAVLMLGICGVFGLLSLYSLYSYWNYLSKPEVTTADLPSSGQESPTSSSTDGDRSPVPRESSWQLTKDRFRDVKDGFVIVLGERQLGWRLLFLALETALEDAVVSVVIPQIALQMTPLLWSTFYPPPPPPSPSHSLALSSIGPSHPSIHFPSQYELPPILPGGWTFVNLIAVSLIAVGKSGGLASGSYMSSRWIAPATIEKSGPYCKLFRCMFYSSASLLTFPLAYFFLLEAQPFQLAFAGVFTDETIDAIRGIVAIVLVAIGGFLFFVFSTAPKIGFATLLHSLVVQRDIDPKVFGFVGTFVTITDAVIILALNLVFAFCGPNQFLLALTISSGIYLLHGLAELVMGPRLILDSAMRRESNESDGFPNLFRCDNEQSSAVIMDNGMFAPVEHRNSRTSGRVLESSARDLTPNWGIDPLSSNSGALSALEPMVPNGIDGIGTGRHLGSWATSNN